MKGKFSFLKKINKRTFFTGIDKISFRNESVRKFHPMLKFQLIKSVQPVGSVIFVLRK